MTLYQLQSESVLLRLMIGRFGHAVWINRKRLSVVLVLQREQKRMSPRQLIIAKAFIVRYMANVR